MAAASSKPTQESETCTLELSVVVPCLNEAETLPECIEKVRRVLCEHRIAGEIIVADNGSTDGSSDIAARMGVRVVRVRDKGYGNALRGGTASARGKYVITVDADNSHDLAEIPTFLNKLQSGYDLVIGNRFTGGILPGALPPLHRYFGSPVLTRVGQLFFRSPCGDQQCGFRGFSRVAFSKMRLRATGMEFASEMVLKAASLRLRIAEVPTTHFLSGRRRPPHLRPWRDGWRHLRLMLLHSPRWLFLYWRPAHGLRSARRSMADTGTPRGEGRSFRHPYASLRRHSGTAWFPGHHFRCFHQDLRHPGRTAAGGPPARKTFTPHQP